MGADDGGKRKCRDPVGEDAPRKKRKKSNAVEAADAALTPGVSGASVCLKVKKEKKPQGEMPQAAQSIEDATEVGFAEKKKKKKKKEKKPKDDCEIKARVEENAAAKGTEKADVADKDAEPNKTKKKKITHEEDEEKGAKKSVELRFWFYSKTDDRKQAKYFERIVEELSKERIQQLARHMTMNSGLIWEACDLHKMIIQPFEGLSAEEALNRLSDPAVSMKLTLPSFRVSGNSPPRTFTFVGHKRFPNLLELVKAGGRTNFRIYYDRGKSYLLAAMACYLHTYEDQCGIVVYLLMSKLIGNFDYLLEALLLAYARDPSKQWDVLASSTSEKELLAFCRLAAPVCLLDEMKELDKDKETGRSTAETRDAARLWQNEFYVAGVSCT